MDIQIGDDITISGKATLIYNEQFIIVKSQSGENYFVNVNDIKTHRPMRREEDE